jgi:sugar/nucleoside kinase (ribokinase family)
MKALPCEGQLLAIDAMPQKIGGCAANVAIDLVKQGLSVDLIGCVGDDSDAVSLRRQLETCGIDCERLVQVNGLPTSKTVILLVEGCDRRYIHVFGANQALTVNHIARDWVTELDVFYLGGLLAIPGIDMDDLLGLLRYCREQKVITVVDVVVPQGFSQTEALAGLLPHIDYFLPNDEEARQITAQTDVLDQLRWFRNRGAQTTIITKGRDGAFAARDSTYWQAGAYQVDAVDPSGSGDAFTSGIIAALTLKWDVPTMLRYASAIGASATQAIGTTDSVFTAEEAHRFVKGNPIQIRQGDLDAG